MKKLTKMKKLKR